MIPLSTRSRRALRLALLGYFGLFLLLPLWYLWLAPSEQLPAALVITVLVGPLLFPLRGLLRGRPYTYAWTSFLALFYLLHATGELFARPDERHLAVLELVLSLCLYLGAMLYARYRGRELKAGQEQE